MANSMRTKDSAQVTLNNILKRVAPRSLFADRLITGDDGWARDTYAFLERCYGNLAASDRQAWARRMTGDQPQIEATIRELVAHELLLRLGCQPQYEPEVEGRIPDLKFYVGQQEFVADVAVVHTPDRPAGPKDRPSRRQDRTYRRIGNAVEMVDMGERAKQIADKIEEKAGKYSALKTPLVVFVFRGDHYMWGVPNVLEAVLGYPLASPKIERVAIPHLIHTLDYTPGLFWPDDFGVGRFPNLSAVVGCDWFDTLRIEDGGKRLYCLIIHHWAARVPLAMTAFREFSQVVWTQQGPDTWEWQFTVEGNIVARLPPTGGIEFRPYSSDNPW